MTVTILKGDCREVLRDLPDESVHCVVTSPPYWGLRDYGVAGQIGLEADPYVYINGLNAAFNSIKRVLRADGTVWLNLGDTYAHSLRQSPNKAGDKQNTNAGSIRRGFGPIAPGCKEKDLIGIPWRVAFALQANGWWLRQDIIWSKPNPMPESVTDRCTKAHEYLFLLSKSERYYFDQDAIAEAAAYSGLANQDESGFKDPRRFNGKHQSGYNTSGRAKDTSDTARPPNSRPHSLGKFEAENEREYATRNKRSVWEVATAPFPEAHFATFPPALVEPCILAGCPKGGTVLDPFGGAGTVGLVSDRLGRNAILIELNPEYAAMAERRIKDDAPLFAEVSG